MKENNAFVVLDTSFFIRLLNAEDPLHENARAYFVYFLNNGFQLCVSTIAVAEFCVKDVASRLPLKNLVVIPFNYDHAIIAGKMIAAVNEKRKSDNIKFAVRAIIPNDTKMFAQAQSIEGEVYYATSDAESKKIYNILAAANMAKFHFIDIHQPCNETFGLLFETI